MLLTIRLQLHEYLLQLVVVLLVFKYVEVICLGVLPQLARREMTGVNLVCGELVVCLNMDDVVFEKGLRIVAIECTVIVLFFDNVLLSIYKVFLR